jgi:hypothetical protein
MIQIIFGIRDKGNNFSENSEIDTIQDMTRAPSNPPPEKGGLLIDEVV